MSEYEKVMKVLFDRGLPSETCGRVASIFEKKEELERQLEEAREIITSLTGEQEITFLNSLLWDMLPSDSTYKLISRRIEQLKEKGDE